MAEFVLPEAMVQAAIGCWLVRAATSVEASPEEHVRAILTAALSGCEVREEWGARIEFPGDSEALEYWRGPRSSAEATLQAHERGGFTTARSLVRRLVITTPAGEVPDA